MNIVKSDSKLSAIDGQLAQPIAQLEAKYHKLNEFYSKLNQLIEGCQDIEHFYNQLHQLVNTVLKAEHFFIALFAPASRQLEYVYMVDQNLTKPQRKISLTELDGSLTAYVIENQQQLRVNPQTLKKMVNDHLIAPIYPDIHWLGVPLIKNGNTIGIVAVSHCLDLPSYSEQDQSLLNLSAQQIVLALQILDHKSQLQQAVEFHTSELREQIREHENSELLQESLLHISELNSKKLTIEVFYDQVRNIIGQLLSCSNFYVAKYCQTEQTIELVYHVDQFTETDLDNQLGKRVAVGNSLIDYVIKQAKPILLSQSEISQLIAFGEIAPIATKYYSWLGVPLISQGEIIGAMVVQSYNPDIIFTEQDADILKFVSHHVSMAIKRREAAEYKEAAHEILEQKVEDRTAELKRQIAQRHLAEKKLQHTASHDALTGLPNRALFIETLNHAIIARKSDPAEHFAVLFLDLDRFKSVNDTLGHHAGDLLLQQVAADLKSMVRETDMVARLGGDEFVVIITNIVNDSEAVDIAARMTSKLAHPYSLLSQQVQIGTSIGILYGAHRYDNALIMLRDADTALYQAKDSGRGCFEIFDTSMHQRVIDTYNLEVEIREGLEQGEFIPYFQPIVDLATDKIVGFEALARWNSTKRGLVMPDDFIPQAEESGLIGDIDLQILAKAARQLKIWQTQLSMPALYVSSNFDCSQFFDKSMPGFVASLLKLIKLEPSCLILELTERGLLEDEKSVQQNMQALKQIGVKLALDDFGTGYSSLSYLHRYPIDILKIDRSFIYNIEQNSSHKAIVNTIVSLAKNLNMKVIAEGIESNVEANYLRTLKASFGQGFYYSCPVTAQDAKNLLLQQQNITALS